MKTIYIIFLVGLFIFVNCINVMSVPIFKLKNGINKFAYINIYDESKFIFKYVYKTNDTLIVCHFTTYEANDSIYNVLEHNNTICSSINNPKLLIEKPELYLYDPEIQQYQKKRVLLSISYIDTCFIKGGKVYIKMGKNSVPLIDITIAKQSEINENFEFEDYNFDKINVISLIDVISQPKGKVYHFNFDDPNIDDDEYSYYYLENFWIIRYTYSYIADYKLRIYNGVLFFE